MYLPSSVSSYREQAIKAYGAETTRVAGNYNLAEELVKAHSADRGWTLISDASHEGYTEIPSDVMLGYAVMMSEITDRLPLESFTHIFLQCGVGSFAGALCDYVHSKLGAKAPMLITVEPVNAACVFRSIEKGSISTVAGDLDTIMAGLACGRPSPLAFDVLRKCVSHSIRIEDEWALAAVRLLSEVTLIGKPIVAGETGAAGLGALLWSTSRQDKRNELGLDSKSRVLLFCTEGATDPHIYNNIVRGHSNAEV